MRFLRFALVLGLGAILALAIYQTVIWLGLWGAVNVSQVKELHGDDQEIALIEPATSTDDWGRQVTSLQLVERDWPRINPTLPALQVNVKGAFPPLSAEVPEIVLSFAGGKGKLRLRWYKITGEHDAASWIAKLHARSRPPLAIIGGATSDRALRLARALKEAYPDPESSSPAFIITTATADQTDEGKVLIEEYLNRSFRFSFTNRRMVDSLLKFAKQTPNLWASKAAPRDKHVMYAFSWDDERYSKDLNELFMTRYPRDMGDFFGVGVIPYGVGDFFRPAPLEQDAIGAFLSFHTPIPPQSFLVLPTQSVRMRRFLINLRQRAPLDARNLVILNGDAISFNTVYRDRDVLWNIFDLPYSLVFFSHRNPVDRAAGFVSEAELSPDDSPRRTTSTHDILLYRDLFETVLYAAFDQGAVVADPLEMRARLRSTAWHRPPADKGNEQRVCNTRVHEVTPKPHQFFSDRGNRRIDTGEHIVWVKPNFIEDRVDRASKISVWSLGPDSIWKENEVFQVEYNRNP